MIKTKFARFCDITVFVVGTSLIVFAWVNKYIKLTIWSALITGIFSFILAKVLWSTSTSKQNKLALKNQEIKFAQNCINSFALNPQQTLHFFNKLIENSRIVNNHICANNAIYFFDYSSEETQLKTIIEINQASAEYDNCYLYSSSISEKCKQLIGQTKIIWINDYDCYLQMKEKNMFPISEQKNNEIQRGKLKQTFALFLERKKAKPYFIYGVLLLATSFIMPYSLLYCITGTVSIVFALLCIIVKNYKTKALS